MNIYSAIAEDKPYTLDEITVTGTRSERDTFGTPNAVSVITSEELGRKSLGTTPDMLRGATGVMVQKTTAGQGSPYVRGLTGYQTLIIVDGVRLTNCHFPIRTESIFIYGRSQSDRKNRGNARLWISALWKFSHRWRDKCIH